MVEVFRGCWLNPAALLMAQFSADGTRVDLTFVGKIERTITGTVRVRAVRQLLQVIEWGTLTDEVPQMLCVIEDEDEDEAAERYISRSA